MKIKKKPQKPHPYLVCACWSAPKANLCGRHLSWEVEDYD